MDILFPSNERELVDFKESAIKMGFEELTVECTASLSMLQPHDRLSVLIMGWRRIGDYLTKNQYASYVGNVVNWIGRHTLELWFGRDWISCPAENKTTLIEFMMKVYPTAYISMCPYSWPYMFSIYRDPWMVDYLNANFQHMNDPDLSDRLEVKDSDFIQQEGLFLIFLRIVNMFDFNMMKLVKHMCRRLLLAWHDTSSSAHRSLRTTLNAAESIEYVRHMYLMTVNETDGLQALHYVLECVQRNMHCNAIESCNLDKAAHIITLGLLECKQTLVGFLVAFVSKSHQRQFSNTLSSVIDKYKSFLIEYLIRKIHNRKATDNMSVLSLEGVYENLVKMFIKRRESSEDLMRTTTTVSERLFARVHSLKALKFSYNQIKTLTRAEWYTTKVTLLLGIISEELNTLEDYKYTEGQIADELIQKEKDLALYYRDLSILLGRTPVLEQEAWLTTFSLHPCKEYLEAVTKCGSRNLRVIKKQAIKLKVLLESKQLKASGNVSIQTECASSNKFNEESCLDPEKEECSYTNIAATEGSYSIEDETNAKQAVGISKRLPSKKTANKGKGDNKSSDKTAMPISKRPPIGDVRDKHTAEVMFAASAGAGESVGMQTLETIKYPDFALINSVTDTEDVIKYTKYDGDVLAQYRELTRILSNIRLQHSNYDDLLALLIAPRYKRLTWASCWKNLRKRCRLLLTKDNKKKQLVEQYLADANERLTHLQIDYEKFKNKPQIDYGSIEDGYECFDTESSDETGLKIVAAGEKQVTKIRKINKKTESYEKSHFNQVLNKNKLTQEISKNAAKIEVLYDFQASKASANQTPTLVSQATYTLEAPSSFVKKVHEVTSMQNNLESQLNQFPLISSNIHTPSTLLPAANNQVNSRIQTPASKMIPPLQIPLNPNLVTTVDSSSNQNMQALLNCQALPSAKNQTLQTKDTHAHSTHTFVTSQSFSNVPLPPTFETTQSVQARSYSLASMPSLALQETSSNGKPSIFQNKTVIKAIQASCQETSNAHIQVSPTTQISTCIQHTCNTQKVSENQLSSSAPVLPSVKAVECSEVQENAEASQNTQPFQCNKIQHSPEIQSSTGTILSTQSGGSGRQLKCVQTQQISKAQSSINNDQENYSVPTSSPEDQMCSMLETKSSPIESLVPNPPLKTYSRHRSTPSEKEFKLTVESKHEKCGIEIISIKTPKAKPKAIKYLRNEFKKNFPVASSTQDGDGNDVLTYSLNTSSSQDKSVFGLSTSTNNQTTYKSTINSEERSFRSISHLGVIEHSVALDHNAQDHSTKNQHMSVDNQLNRDEHVGAHSIRHMPTPFITITPLPRVNTQAQQFKSPSNDFQNNNANKPNNYLSESLKNEYCSIPQNTARYSQNKELQHPKQVQVLSASVCPHPYRNQPPAILAIQNKSTCCIDLVGGKRDNVNSVEIAICTVQKRPPSPTSSSYDSYPSSFEDTTHESVMFPQEDMQPNSRSESEVLLCNESKTDINIPSSKRTLCKKSPTFSNQTDVASPEKSKIKQEINDPCTPFQTMLPFTAETGNFQLDVSEKISKQIPFVDLRAITKHSPAASADIKSISNAPQSHMYTYFPPELNTVQIVKPSGTTRINKMRIEIGQGIRRKIPKERHDLLRLTSANKFPNPRWRPIYSSIFKRKLIFVPTETELRMILSEYKGQRQNGRIPAYLNICGLTEDHPDEEAQDESVIINLTNPKYVSEGSSHLDAEPDEMLTCKTKQVTQSRPEVEGQEAGVKYKFHTRSPVHFFIGIPTPAYHLSLFCPCKNELQSSSTDKTGDILTIEPNMIYKMFLFLKEDDFVWEKFSLVRFNSPQKDEDDDEQEDEKSVGVGMDIERSGSNINFPATEANVTQNSSNRSHPEREIIQIEISSESDTPSEHSEVLKRIDTHNGQETEIRAHLEVQTIEEDIPHAKPENKSKSVLGPEEQVTSSPIIQEIKARHNTESQQRNNNAEKKPEVQNGLSKPEVQNGLSKSIITPPILEIKSRPYQESTDRFSDALPNSLSVKPRSDYIRMRKLVVRLERWPEHLMMNKLNPTFRDDFGSDSEILLRRSGRYALKVYGAGSRSNRRSILPRSYNRQPRTADTEKNITAESELSCYSFLHKDGNDFNE